VDNLEIDESRTASFSVVNNICSGRVSVRPAAVEFVASKLMSAPKFGARGFQHPSGQRTLIQMFPETFTRQLIEVNRPGARAGSAKTIAIEHLKAACLPVLPLFGFAPEADWYVRHTKIQIREIGQLFTVNVASLDHDGLATTDFLRD
jgi:hypothetical protein